MNTQRAKPVSSICSIRASFAVSLIVIACGQSLQAQELEVRRWNHLPIDTSFATLNVVTTDGDITFDPVLQIEDAKVRLHTVVFAYLRTFEAFGKTARFELRQGWQEGTWTGLVRGAPASVKREGPADTILRFAIGLSGSPPLSGKEYLDYRKSRPVETLFGAAVGVQLPTGDYEKDKLINIGTNRFAIRPQVGFHHQNNSWSFEGTATAAFFGDNDALLRVNTLSQDPAYSLDGSVEYQFPNSFWVAFNAGINIGGETQVNGVDQDDARRDVGWALSAGYSISPKLSLKVSYIDIKNREEVGTSSRSLSFNVLTTW